MTQLLLWNQNSYKIWQQGGTKPKKCSPRWKKRCAFFFKYPLITRKSYLIHEVLIGWIILNGSCQYMEDYSQKF